MAALSCRRLLTLLSLAELGAELFFFGCAGAIDSFTAYGALVVAVCKDDSGLSGTDASGLKIKRLLTEQADW